MNPLVYLTDWIKCGAIAFGMVVTPPLQPYQNFNRPPDIDQNISLDQKAAIFEQDILDNHITSEGIFMPTVHPVDFGDMCIWNGVHVAYRAIRYGTTHDPKDLALLKKYMISLELLQTNPVTGQTELMRARIPKAEFDGTYGGFREVHQTDTLIYQEDASGDQFSGQVYGMAMAWKYGDQEVKDYIGILARDLYLTAKKNNWHFYNGDGTKTKYSPTGPSVLSSPMDISIYLVLTKILELQYPNDLEVGHEYHKWAITWNQIHVASHNVPAFLWFKKYSGINQAMMETHALLELETNPRYHKKYEQAAQRAWRLLDEDGYSYFTFIVEKYVPKIVNQRQKDKAIQVLNEFSTDKKVGVEVDLRKDTSFRHVTWDGDKSVQPYPVWKAPAKNYQWQRDPHDTYDHLGCHDNCEAYSGVDFLIAYYIGKQYGYIK